MADLTELNFFSRQDLFDLTKEMSSCAAQLLKKYFKSKKNPPWKHPASMGWLSPLLKRPAVA